MLDGHPQGTSSCHCWGSTQLRHPRSAHTVLVPSGCSHVCTKHSFAALCAHLFSPCSLFESRWDASDQNKETRHML